MISKWRRRRHGRTCMAALLDITGRSLLGIVKMQAFEFEQTGVFSLTPPDVAKIANNAYLY